MTTYLHIVLFKMKPDTSPDQIRGVCAAAMQAGALESWADWSLDERKGSVLIEFIRFIDAAAFKEFQALLNHASAGVFMRTVADWTIGDHLVDDEDHFAF